MSEIISRKDAKAAGLKKYATGVACKHGHVAERLVCNGVCLACGPGHRADHYEKNKDAILKRTNRYYAENKEADRDAKLARSARYRAENREALRQTEVRRRAAKKAASTNK